MREYVLVVEDSTLNSKYIKDILEGVGYGVIQAFNGYEALEKLKDSFANIKAITLDRHMPKMDGMQLAIALKEDKIYSSIPVIFVTDLAEKSNILEGLEMGVYDYLPKPVDSDLLQVKVKNAVKTYNQELNLKKLNKKVEDRNKRLEKIVESRTKKLKNLTNSILNILEEAATYNDKDTGNHIERVAAYSALLAEKSGLGHKVVKDIKNYSPLHDIGKIGIPHEILKKPGRLTEEEFKEMKEHVIIGKELLSGSTMPPIASNIIMYHHERWDGKGYPYGLKGEDIPIEARIVTIVDVFDALTSKRPYKDAFTIEKASLIMMKDMYGHFDPDLLKLFFDSMEEVKQAREEINNKDIRNI